jgi:hypothetical protein
LGVGCRDGRGSVSRAFRKSIVVMRRAARLADNTRERAEIRSN